MVARRGRLDGDLLQVRAVEQMARQLAAGAREVGSVRRMAAHDRARPERRPEHQRADQGAEQDQRDHGSIQFAITASASISTFISGATRAETS